MIKPKLTNKIELWNWYGSLDWELIKLDKLVGWKRHEMKIDILLAVSIQINTKRCQFSDLVKVIGFPDHIESFNNTTHSFYNFRQNTIGLFGKYAYVIVANNDKIVVCGSNRFDMFDKRISKKTFNHRGVCPTRMMHRRPRHKVFATSPALKYFMPWPR